MSYEFTESGSSPHTYAFEADTVVREYPETTDEYNPQEDEDRKALDRELSDWLTETSTAPAATTKTKTPKGVKPWDRSNAYEGFLLDHDEHERMNTERAKRNETSTAYERLHSVRVQRASQGTGHDPRLLNTVGTDNPGFTTRQLPLVDLFKRRLAAHGQALKSREVREEFEDCRRTICAYHSEDDKITPYEHRHGFNKEIEKRTAENLHGRKMYSSQHLIEARGMFEDNGKVVAYLDVETAMVEDHKRQRRNEVWRARGWAPSEAEQRVFDAAEAEAARVRVHEVGKAAKIRPKTMDRLIAHAKVREASGETPQEDRKLWARNIGKLKAAGRAIQASEVAA